MSSTPPYGVSEAKPKESFCLKGNSASLTFASFSFFWVMTCFCYFSLENYISEMKGSLLLKPRSIPCSFSPFHFRIELSIQSSVEECACLSILDSVCQISWYHCHREKKKIKENKVKGMAMHSVKGAITQCPTMLWSRERAAVRVFAEAQVSVCWWFTVSLLLPWVLALGGVWAEELLHMAMLGCVTLPALRILKRVGQAMPPRRGWAWRLPLDTVEFVSGDRRADACAIRGNRWRDWCCCTDLYTQD